MRQPPAHSRRSFIKTGLLFVPSARCVAANVVFGDRPFRFGATPQSIAGLKFWLHPYSGIYTDTAMNTLCANGDTVNVWRDANGFANFANTTNQPIYKTNILNTFPVVEFGATVNTALVSAHGNVAQTFSLHLVQEISNAQGNPCVWLGGIGSPNFSQISCGVANANSLYMFSGSPIACGVTITPSQWYYYSFLFNGASSTSFQNGVQQSGPASSPGAAGIANTQMGGTGFSAVMRVAEACLFAPAVSAADRQNLEAYFHAKYRI